LIASLSIREKKSEARQKALTLRRSLPSVELARLSSQIEARLYTLAEYSHAGTVATYVEKSDEVQTGSIIRHSIEAWKRVLVPKTDPVGRRLIFSELRDPDRDLEPGQMGILEPDADSLRPVDLTEADLVLVPVVAWDERGYRLGYGRGYFDRALAGVKCDVMTAGLALELQRSDELPIEDHDVPLKMIITEKRVIPTGVGGDEEAS
jgi:5-formyltetrahydrofolate cyclo-ligase